MMTMRANKIKMMILTSFIGVSVGFGLFMLMFKPDLNFLSKGNMYCQDNGRSKPYCQYEGKITELYLNREGLLTVKLATPFSAEQFSVIKLDPNTVSLSHVAMLVTPFSPADALHIDTMQSWLTKAYVQGKDIKVHLRGDASGYLLIDRIWW